MLKSFKFLALRSLKRCGLFELSANSEWRNRRLLILCYHGVAIEDESAWRPELYIRQERLQQRLQLLKDRRCSVLRLNDAIERLSSNRLPPRSVAITFDDGGYDFYKQAYPLLKHYGFPVTVYQTTYYSVHRHPVFHLICSYLLWKRRGEVIRVTPPLGLPQELDLRTEASRERWVAELVSLADRDQLSAQQRDELAGKLAAALGIDYDRLLSQRILQLMRPEELQELSAEGVDFQLHTHRHRSPMEAALFRKEIRENRAWLEKWTGMAATHFCYPSGVYEAEFLPWLVEEHVASATTCEPGLASTQSNPLVLPRFVDTGLQPQLVFEGWLAGVTPWLPHRPGRRGRFSVDNVPPSGAKSKKSLD